MKKILDGISFPDDIKRLKPEDLSALSAEIREFMVGCVAKTGGHLASSLGAVELTVALHYVFNAPKDKIIWDVGHQAYAHKILTGRKDSFKTLRQSGGISGFLKPSESPYDAATSGHSSTSISTALGMAVARDLKGEKHKVIAVIGDGSLTAGLAFEGLNQAGHLKKDLIVIVNDNEMSISKNVGALSSLLSRNITGRVATRLKTEAENLARNIPRIGGGLASLIKRAEDSLITLFTPGMLFEGLGFHYVGPIDGHNMDELLKVFEDIKEVKGPILLHVLTRKGKGYAPAEADPSLFHGIGAFDSATGEAKKFQGVTYTDIFSSALIEAAALNPKVVAITAAMPEGTGLSKFAKLYPDRFFDVGIAEQHAITFAGGLARSGFIPVAAIYSTFLQRAYDEVFHDICLENLPIVLAIDRAGIVGADGPTHHGVFDISYLRHLPNMAVAAPKDDGELSAMIKSAVGYKRPIAIRYPRGVTDGSPKALCGDIELGRGELLRDGAEVGIIAIGTMVNPALDAADVLAKKGIRAAVVNARFVKPLDAELILGVARKTGRLVTVEENAVEGGFGSAVSELLDENSVECSLRRIGIPDKFVEHGSQDELRRAAGLDTAGIAAAVEEFVKLLDKGGSGRGKTSGSKL